MSDHSSIGWISRLPRLVGFWWVVLVAALGSLTVPAPALAQEGVYVDPESPAGKEYAIPLDAVRRQATGEGAAAKGPAPLFGEGVRSRRSGTRTGSGEGAGSRRRGNSIAGREAFFGAGTSAEQARAAALDIDESAPFGGLVGGGLLVIVAGLGAYVVRRSKVGSGG